jgi:hypothetical protein
MDMNKKIKKLWIKALRSGEFKQGKGYLEKDGSHCALGVLSVLALLEGQCTYNTDGPIGRFDNKRFGLSLTVMKWARIAQDKERFLKPDEDRVIVNYKKKPTTLADLNDRGLTFKEIALIIQRNL